jgi:5-methylcytosine-specific restriction protein A
MQFNNAQLNFFGAEAGAGSIVTRTEATDPQITIDRFERDVLYSLIPPEKIYRGSKKVGGERAIQSFFDHFSGTELEIPLVFPKLEKNELRIYNSNQTGFHPKAGHMWFIYRKNGKLFVGSMPEDEWRAIGGETLTLEPDDDDSDLQQAILSGDDRQITTTSKFGTRFTRCPKLARKALERAQFRCEVQSSSLLFLSRATKRPYLEAHHLVPLYARERLGIKISLDRLNNIVALAPHWHRAIHHASPEVIEVILRKLAIKRHRSLGAMGLNVDDLLYIYRTPYLLA